MSFSKEQAIIQAMLFATGREVSKKEIMNVLEIGEDDIEKIIENMRIMLEEQNSSLEIIKVEDSYQMCTKKEYYEYIYPLIDSRSKPNISNAALETLSIIASTRAYLLTTLSENISSPPLCTISLSYIVPLSGIIISSSIFLFSINSLKVISPTL